MIEIMFTPKWFYGKDILIDIISIAVLFLIAFFSIQFYRMNNKNKNHLILAISYFMIGIAFIAKILMNFTLYYHVVETRIIGFMKLTYPALKSTDTLFFGGFLIYRLLALLGFFMLYSIYNKKQSRSDGILIIYLIAISTYFSQNAYYIFHMTCMILVGLISYRYFKIYKKTQNPNTKWLMYTFGLITFSQLLFIFVKFDTVLYAIAEVIQLIGFGLLLISFIKVLNIGKKKNKN